MAQLLLGLNAPYNLSDVIAGNKTVSEVSITHEDGLILIPGAFGNAELANINALTAQSLIQSIFNEHSDLDIIVVDAAAGLSESNLTFMCEHAGGQTGDSAGRTSINRRCLRPN